MNGRKEDDFAVFPEQIENASRRLGQQLAECPLYRNASTIYGYLPYNQEVRTVPMLQRALDEGKRVAVPTVYGDEMKFIYLDDLSQVAGGYKGICEPILEAIKTVAQEQGGAFVLTGDLPSNNEDTQSGDGIHFCRESLHILGKRYFMAYAHVCK